MASSDDSVEAAARFGGRMTMFADRAWEHRMPSIARYRTSFLEHHGRPAPSFRFGGILFAEAEASMGLFASEVLPVLRSWD